MTKKIIIAGAGGIGRACGLLLLQHFGEDLELVFADVHAAQCDEAIAWVQQGLSFRGKMTMSSIPTGNPEDWNPDGDVLLDCTPGKFAPGFATVALRNNMHYANLTEHVPATRKIYELARNARTGFALQTGLAPGFINLLALKSEQIFSRDHPTFPVDRIQMRVGSLSQFAASPAYYAFVWSPMGVSTEYLNESEVIEASHLTRKSSLTEREHIIINGRMYEADLTSGGAADLPAYYEGKIRNLNYKTLRYPGHFDYIIGLKKGLGAALTKESLLEKMLEDIPLQDQDRVLIYCSISGIGPDMRRKEKIYFREILPTRIGAVHLTAIQRTTAASLAQTAVLLLSNQYSGLLTQSRYPLDKFMTGNIVVNHYGTFFPEHEITRIPDTVQ